MKLLPAMAMASSASCCVSHGRPHPLHAHLPTTSTPARLRLRLRLVSRSAPSRNPRPISSSPSPPAAAADEEHCEDTEEEDRDERYGFEMEVRKLPGKKNRRAVRARVRVGAPLEAVWATLTDYEGLADFIPGLSECRLLHRDKDAAFARLYQVGEQDLALGFKFNAKGTIDCYEGEMEELAAGARRREIAFNMVDGDFKVFEGKWCVEEADERNHDGEISASQESQTTLSYVVELEPKLWVPVRLLEGRICKEIKTNLICIRQEAERIQRLQG